MRRRKMALRRRIRMLIVALILVVVGILIVPISRFRVAAGEKNHSRIEYRTYVVQRGDTLWGLADSYMGENFGNHQDYIEEVMRANGMDRAFVYAGQLLIIPYEADMVNSTQIAAANE